MLNPNAQKWVDALRSGEYAQGRGAMTTIRDPESPKHCCLGVACVVAMENGVPLTAKRAAPLHERYVIEYDRHGATSILPSAVVDWLGLRSSSYMGLATMNDNGASFESIAEHIERHADVLFG